MSWIGNLWQEIYAIVWMARHNGQLWWTCRDCRATRRAQRANP